MRLWIGLLSFLLLVSGSHCGSEAASARSGTTEIVLVRNLTATGGIIEFSTRGELAVLTGESLTVFDPVTGDTLDAIAPPHILGDEITGRALAFSNDGGLLAASTNSSLVVFDLDGGTQIFRKTYPADHVLWSMGALTFAGDSGMLLVAGQRSPVVVLDVRTGDIVDSLGGLMDITGISILPDRSTAALATFGGEVILWDWTSGDIVDTLRGCGSWCNAVASTDSMLVAACGSDSIRVWDSRTLGFRGVIERYEFIGQHFSVSASGLLLAGSGSYRTEPGEGMDSSEIILFDLRTLEPVASWGAHSSAGIYDTAITPDGDIFATCGYDGAVIVWRRKGL